MRMGVGSARLLLAGRRSPSCRSVRGAYQGIAKAWLAVVRVVSQACLTCTKYRGRVGGVRRACRRPKSEQSPAGVAAAALHITH